MQGRRGGCSSGADRQGDRDMNRRKSLHAALAASPALLAMAAPARAQEDATTASAPQAGLGEEIIVTAQRREQALIEVPQAISVVSGATLEGQQADSFADYLKLVPGLQIDE